MIVAVMLIAVAACEQEHAPPLPEDTDTVVKEHFNYFSNNNDWAILRFALYVCRTGTAHYPVHFQYLDLFNSTAIIILTVPREVLSIKHFNILIQKRIRKGDCCKIEFRPSLKAPAKSHQ